jgi:hypothetical protein
MGTNIGRADSEPTENIRLISAQEIARSGQPAKRQRLR